MSLSMKRSCLALDIMNIPCYSTPGAVTLRSGIARRNNNVGDVGKRLRRSGVNFASVVKGAIRYYFINLRERDQLWRTESQ